MKTLKFKESNPNIYRSIEPKLLQLTLNDYIKIQVEAEEGSEIFWARVLKVLGSNISVVVVNDLILKESFGFSRGDEIQVEKRNVLEIMKDVDVAIISIDFKGNLSK